jgi:hypothetical protein
MSDSLTSSAQMFDAATDALVPAHRHQPQTIFVRGPEFVNPDARIAEAQAALKAALADARHGGV